MRIGGISLKQRIKNSKDKIVGTMKETTGRVLDKDDLEFKGKMQTIKADIGNKFEDVSDVIVDKVENMKTEVARKTNDFIDQVKFK